MSVIADLGIIANHIPSMVPPDARVTVGLHLTDPEAFDALVAEHDAAVWEGGGNEDCPHTFRSARIEVNGVEVVLYVNEVQPRPVVDVTVLA